MEAKAIAKSIRIAPRKVRLVVDLVRGKAVGEALAILNLTPKGSTLAVTKVLKSAIANAKNNYEMNMSNLYVKDIQVTEGPTMKRFLPRAKGSASSIMKRSSHITVVVAEKN